MTRLEHPCRRRLRVPARQGGAALLVLLAIIVVAVLSAVLARLPAQAPRARLEQASARALAEAREAVIAWALAHPTQPGRLPMPDRNGDNSYDDLSDCTSPVLDSHLLGRLPIRGETDAGGTNCQGALAFGPETRARDGAGERLWYAVSRHFVRDAAVPGSPRVVPSLLAEPDDWLTLTDAAGNVIQAQAAFVLIAPGAPVAGQQRGAAAPDADNFLDALNAGTPQFAANYDADRHFVIAPERATRTNADPFNDRVVYATARRLIEPLTTLALSRTADALRSHHALHGAFPDAAANDDGVCTAGAANGFLPASDGDCGASLTLPAWLDPNWLPEIGYQRVGADLARLNVAPTGQFLEVSP